MGLSQKYHVKGTKLSYHKFNRQGRYSIDDSVSIGNDWQNSQ